MLVKLYVKASNLLESMKAKVEGQGMIEYALIAGFISVIAYLTIQAVGPKVNTYWGSVNTALT
jgi:Flp pilus assembly pilin Flp